MEEITFVNVLGNNGRSRMKRVYLRGHCVFCLRKTDKPKVTPDGKRARMDEMNTVPEVDLTAYSGSTLLSTVNWACGVLQRKDGDDDIFEEGTKSSTNFCKIPKLCMECGDKIFGVDKLLTEVREGMRELRKVIRNWNTLLTCKDFGVSLSFSGLGESKVEETMEFLEEFRNRMGLQKEPVVSAATTEKEEEPEIILMETDPLLLTTTEGTGTTSGDRIRELSKQHVKTTEKVLQTRKSEVILMETDPLLLTTEETEPTTSKEMRVPTSYTNNNSPLEYENETSSENDTEEDDDSDSDPDYVKSEIEDSSDGEDLSDIDDDQADSPPDPIIKVEADPKSQDRKIDIPTDPESSSSDSSESDEEPKPKKKCYSNKKVGGKTYKYVKKNVTCDQCGRNLFRENLRKHREVCGKIIEYKYPRVSCRFCRKETTMSTFRGHLYKEHPDKVVPVSWETSKRIQACDLCNLKTSRKLFYQHLKDHVGTDEYITRCPNPKCHFKCITGRALYRHLRGAVCCLKAIGMNSPEEYRNSVLVCSACGFSGDNIRSRVMRSHLLREHETTEKNYTCPISGCGMRFTLKQTVVLHLGHHDVPKQVESQPCGKCDDKKKIKLEEMEDHLKEVHGVDQVIKCRKCPFLFPSWEELVDHMYQHRFGELTCYICEEAGGRFARHVKLVEHYFTQHQIGTKSQCDQCPRSFWKEKSLHLHVTYDHNQTEHQSSKFTSKKTKSFVCEECENVVFKTEDRLRTHKIREHGATPYSCLLCTQTFTKKVALDQHDKEVHKGVVLQKEFPCLEPNCGKVCKSKYQLKCHNKFTHLQERNHKCGLCGKTYRTAGGLKAHNDIVHLGIKNFVCDECGEGFASGQVLKKHKRIHTGERNYSCNICGQLFRHKEALKAHLDGHQRKGADFRPNGPMKHIRKRVQIKRKAQAMQGSSAECPKD